MFGNCFTGYLDDLMRLAHRFRHPKNLASLAGPLAFWGLLAVATWLLIEPVWVGTIPPFTDFPAHASIADVWSRYDEVDFYQTMFELRDGLAPNVLGTRFVSLLYPLVDPLTGLRIFASVVMASTVAALVAMARAFDRSAWLVFLALPFLWNGSMYWGMINYVAIFPFFFAAIALARHAGQRDDWRFAAGLMAVCVGAFFTHGLGCLFVFSAAGFVLLLSARRPQNLMSFVAFAPGVGLWMHWRTASSGQGGLPDESLVETLRHHATWANPADKLDRFIEAALDPVLTHQDTIVLVVLGGLWLVLMGLSVGRPDRTKDDSSGDWPSLHDMRAWVGGFWEHASSHTLLLVVVCLGVAAALLPSHIRVTNVSTRVAPLVMMTGALLPRLPRRNWLATVAIAAAIGMSGWFGLFLSQKVAHFDRVQLQPLSRLINQIPPHSRVECLGVRVLNKDIFRGRPADHACPALAQLHTQGFGGFGFPSTGFNAIYFKPGYGYSSLLHGNFLKKSRLQNWDYVLVRGPHRRPSKALIERVDTAQAHAKDAPKWTLYRVRRSTLASTHTEITGGDGGHAFQWDCPQSQALRGVTGYLARSGDIVGNLEPHCAIIGQETTGDGDPETPPTVAHGYAGEWFAKHRNQHASFRQNCPPNQVVVGLSGRSGELINRIQLVCAPLPSRDIPTDADLTTTTDADGGSNGDPFDMQCPPGSYVQGLKGRAGWYLDAIGIRCVRP